MMNGLGLIPKMLEWIWIFSDELLSQAPPLGYIIGTIVIALITLNVMDVMTALTEVSTDDEEGNYGEIMRMGNSQLL